MKNRLELRLAGLLLSLVSVSIAGCGGEGIQALNAPNEENVQALRSEFSQEVSAASQASSGLAERTEASWATLNVNVRFDGPKPSPAELTVSKDTTVCKPGGRPVLDNALEVGDDQSLGNVLVYLSTDLPVDDSDQPTPVWVHGRYKDSRTAEVLFDQEACLFLSPVFAMQTTQTLQVKNSDPVGHNTKLDTKRATPLNVTIEGGDSITYAPGKQEKQPIQVECSVHPWMKAFMIIRDSPYFGVSSVSNGGAFTVADIPAGVELEYRIWVVTEFANPGSTKVTLDGQEVTVKRGGKIKLNLTPGDQPHELNVVVNSSAFGT